MLRPEILLFSSCFGLAFQSSYKASAFAYADEMLYAFFTSSNKPSKYLSKMSKMLAQEF